MSRAILQARSETSSSTSSVTSGNGKVETLPTPVSDRSLDNVDVVPHKEVDQKAVPVAAPQYQSDQDRLPLWRVVLILYSLASGIFLSIMDTRSVSQHVGPGVLLTLPKYCSHSRVHNLGGIRLARRGNLGYSGIFSHLRR